MAANASLNLVSLDFDNLKSNLKAFLKNQSTFVDYDYDGSNMNVLLDILSYNSYLNSFYLNMAVSEGFIDSAQLLSSVISHARELNYTPRSNRSPQALIDTTFTSASNSNLFEIPKGTQFSGTNANGSFIFTTDSSYVLTSSSNTFSISNLAIYEGTYINESYITDSNIENQRFLISNKSVDTQSIVVTVSENNDANVYIYDQAYNLYGLNPDSQIYFVQATLDGYYEIVFGDDVFGHKPLDNSTILITYRITSGDAGNGIASFNIDQNIGQLSTTITTVANSVDGSISEDIESIRFRAPRHYQTQDRAVTTSDYVNMVLENFPVVKSLNVFGGETVTNSVSYGKVFVSPISQSGTILPDSVKTEISNFLNGKNSIGITPVIVDPTFLYIVPTLTVSVNFAQNSFSPADITSMVANEITNYNSTYLENFNTAFRFSKFLSDINNIDSSIVSVQLKNVIKKSINPILNTKQAVTISFNNPIIPGTIQSSQFVYSDNNVYILTDYNPNVNSFVRTGSLSDYTVINTNKTLYLQQITNNNTQNYTAIGTVNYDTGQIYIGSFAVLNFLNNPGIVFTAAPLNEDILAVDNDLIEIDTSSATINVVAV